MIQCNLCTLRLIVLMLSPFMTKRFLGCMDPLQSRSGAQCCPVIPLKEVCRHVAELSQNPHTHIHFLCPPTHLSRPRLSLTRTILKAGLLTLLPAYDSLMSDSCTDPSSLLLHPVPHKPQIYQTSPPSMFFYCQTKDFSVDQARELLPSGDTQNPG